MSQSKLRSALRLESYQNACKPRARHLLSCSDGHPLKLAEVLAMADDECRALWEDLTLCYGNAWGHPLLRQEVARLHGVEPKDVLVNVPQGAIYMAINTLVPYLAKKSGLDKIHVISCCPAYGVLNENPRNLHCDISFWKGRFTDKGWNFDLDELKALVGDNTRLLIFNFPQNPTGYCPTVEEYIQLIEFCKAREIFIFSDEMYMFTNNRGDSDHLPSACTLYNDAISLFGMSKTLAQPGLCIGWLLTKNSEVMQYLLDYKDYLNNGSSTPAEIISIIALRNIDKIIERNKTIIQTNHKLLDDFFAGYKDIFEWHPPLGGTVTMVRVKGWALQLGKGGASGFCECLLEEAGVMLTPGELFEVEDEYFRIGLGRSDIAEGLKAMADFIDKYKNEHGL